MCQGLVGESLHLQLMSMLVHSSSYHIIFIFEPNTNTKHY